MDNKRNKIITIILTIAMTVAILFAIITSVIVHQKEKELADLKNKNEQIEDVIDGTDEQMMFNYQENKIILKKL